MKMKSLTTKIILSALGIALLAAPASAQRARQSHSSAHLSKMQQQPRAGLVSQDVDHGMW